MPTNTVKSMMLNLTVVDVLLYSNFDPIVGAMVA